MHHQVERWAEKTPNAPAVICDDYQIDYTTLNQRANRLAADLRELGVGRNQIVGLYLERSVELIVGLLAISKSGGVFLPIDPIYPPERVEYMLTDSGAMVVITSKELGQNIAHFENDFIAIEQTMEADISQVLPNYPVTEVALEDKVYTIYTSGSTGQPKAASVFHKGLSNLTDWYSQEFEFNSEDRVLIISSISFDLTQRNIWGALCSGSQLHLLPSSYYDPELIDQTIADSEITFMCCAPSAFYPLLDESQSIGQLASLRQVVLGGEAMDTRRLDVAGVMNNTFSIANAYGPTETTATCTYYHVQKEQIAEHQAIPIGKPIPNVRVYLLDEALNPVPVGVIGEIYASGTGVGDGYLNRPDQTASAFLPDPFSNEHGMRMYRTGDLGRYLPDGNVLYVGRSDFQVKIRGLRIELGEIESCLMKHANIRAAAVIAYDISHGDKQLAAYLVSDEDEPATESLRESVSKDLPAYMVPAAYMFLPELPLTPNGKLDRKALPEPVIVDQNRDDVILPRTEFECGIAELWQDLLSVASISIEDNFFDLGGHSLLATQVVSRVRKQFGCRVPLSKIFELPTLKDFAEVVAELAGEDDDSAGSMKVERPEHIPLSFAQQRLWFLDQMEPGSPFYNMPYAVLAKGKLKVDVLIESINEITRRHESFRTIFITQDEIPCQVILDKVTSPVTYYPMEELSDNKLSVEEILQTESVRPFDLTKAPLFRMTVYQIKPEEYLIVETTHHIISDG